MSHLLTMTKRGRASSYSFPTSKEALTTTLKLALEEFERKGLDTTPLKDILFSFENDFPKPTNFKFNSNLDSVFDYSFYFHYVSEDEYLLSTYTNIGGMTKELILRPFDTLSHRDYESLRYVFF